MAATLTPTQAATLQAALDSIDEVLATDPTNMVAQGDRSYIGDLVNYGPASAGFGADPAWNIADALGIAAEYVS